MSRLPNNETQETEHASTSGTETEETAVASLVMTSCLRQADYASRYTKTKILLPSEFCDAWERITNLNPFDDSDYYQPIHLEMNRLYLQLEEIKKDLEAKIKAITDQLLREKSEAWRVAINISRCLDQTTYDLLSVGYQTPEKKGQLTEYVSHLAESLRLSRTLAQKEEAMCDFSFQVAKISKPDISVGKQTYQQIKSVACNNAELPYRSNALLFVRDQINGNSNETELKQFTAHCALSPSQKVKKIGWIIAGVFAVAAVVTLSVLTFGIGGVAAAAVIAVIAKMSMAAAVASSVGVGLVGGAVIFKGGESAAKLHSNTNSFSQKNIVDAVSGLIKSVSPDKKIGATPTSAQTTDDLSVAGGASTTVSSNPTTTSPPLADSSMAQRNSSCSSLEEGGNGTPQDSSLDALSSTSQFTL